MNSLACALSLEEVHRCVSPCYPSFVVYHHSPLWFTLAVKNAVHPSRELGSHQPKRGAKVEYSSQIFRPRITTLHAMTAHVASSIYTSMPTRSRRRVNITMQR